MKTAQLSIDYHGRICRVAAAFRKRGPETILLFHGLGCSKDSFRDIWSHQDFEDYSIFALDYLGFGASSKPEGFSYCLEDHAQVYARAAKERLEGKFHIVAHSMGGAIALLLPPEILNRAASFANLEGNLSSVDGGVVSRKTISVSYPEFVERILPEFKQMAGSLGEGRFFLDEASPLGFYKSAESLVKWTDSGELIARFKELACKKIYYYGEENTAKLDLERLASIETKPIANSGHFMMNDNPDQFYAGLKDFLDRA